MALALFRSCCGPEPDGNLITTADEGRNHGIYRPSGVNRGCGRRVTNMTMTFDRAPLSIESHCDHRASMRSRRRLATIRSAGAMVLIRRIILGIAIVHASGAAHAAETRSCVGCFRLQTSILSRPGRDTLVVSEDRVAILGVCAPAAISVRPSHGAGRLKTRWPSCDGSVARGLRLKGVFKSCKAIKGSIKIRGRRRPWLFRAKRTPCVSADSSQGPRAVLGRVVSGEIGGSGNRVYSAFHDPAPIVDDAFVTDVSSSGAELLLVADDEARLRALTLSVPSGSTFDPSTVTSVGAESTVLALLALTPGITATEPAEAGARLRELRTLPSFPPLVEYVRSSLPTVAVTMLANDDHVTSLLRQCIGEWLDRHPGPQAVIADPPQSNFKISVLDAANLEAVKLRLSNGGFRYVNVTSVGEDAQGKRTASTQGGIGAEPPCPMPGATPITWGSLFSDTDGKPTEVSHQTHFAPEFPARQFWVVGPGLLRRGDDPPAVVSADTITAWGCTMVSYTAAPILDLYLGANQLLSSAGSVAAKTWNAVKGSVDLEKVATANDQTELATRLVKANLDILRALPTALGAAGIISTTSAAFLNTAVGILGAPVSAANLTLALGYWVAAEHSLRIDVRADTLAVGLNASPSSGIAPTVVDLTATVSGSATGYINYTFYCNDSSPGATITPGWAVKIDGTTQNPKTVQHACSYQAPGLYFPKVVVERGTAPTAAGFAAVVVAVPPPTTAVAASTTTTTIPWSCLAPDWRCCVLSQPGSHGECAFEGACLAPTDCRGGALHEGRCRDLCGPPAGCIFSDATSPFGCGATGFFGDQVTLGLTIALCSTTVGCRYTPGRCPEGIPAPPIAPPPAGVTDVIAFSSDRTGNWDVYRMYADGSNQVPLTRGCRFNADPDYSPQGDRIVFSSQRDCDEAKLYTMSADGGDVSLLAGADLAPDGSLFCGPNILRFPRYSPDGSKIVATESLVPGGPSLNRQIVIMNSDGTCLRNLSNNAFNEKDPVFSVDGTQVIFASDGDGDYEIYRMQIDGSRREQLTFAEGDDDTPTVSPDGTSIIFTSQRDGNFDIYRMNLDGSQQHRLTDDPAADGGPAVSPDGSTIAFVSDRDGQYDIYRMHPDGTAPQRLTTTEGTELQPVFKPMAREGGSTTTLPSACDLTSTTLPECTTWLSFAEGDPGPPGDGRSVAGSIFHFASISLAGVTGGLALTVFPTEGANVGSDIQVNFSVPGRALCSAGESHPLPPGRVTVDGVEGIVLEIGQASLAGTADLLSKTGHCGSVTVDDLVVNGVVLPNVVATELDAALLCLRHADVP